MFPIIDAADHTTEAADSSVECFGVGYNSQAQKWMIGQQRGKSIAINTAFNVLVFKV